MSFFKILKYGVLAGWSVSCANDSITFNANQKATMALVSLTDPSGEGQIVGELPSTVEVDKIEGKVIKISSEGYIPQYWIAKDFVAESTKINIALVPFDGKHKKSDKSASANEPFRLLLKAYGALSKGELQLGRELAAKLRDMDPTLAAPHLLIGIAYFNEGKKVEARSEFEKAFALDPEDLEIKKMIDASK